MGTLFLSLGLLILICLSIYVGLFIFITGLIYLVGLIFKLATKTILISSATAAAIGLLLVLIIR